MKRVLVTGANGFVGRSVCRQLLASGIQVRGTVRRAATAADLPEPVESVVIGDIASFDGWDLALEDVDAVVHLVARTHVMKEQVDDPLPLYRQVNVTGTQRLLAGCRASGVGRFVFVSSIKAVGESTSQACTEEMDCKPENAYGVSKREAEQLVLDSKGLEPVVLRPPLIYGPGVIGNFEKILKAVDRGLPLPLSRINNRRSLLYVDNLAAAIMVCLQHPNAARQTFHLADQAPVSTTELVKQMSVALGKRPRLMPVPVSVLRAVGQLTQRQDQVDRLVSSLTVSTEKIERLTGWKPQVSLPQGLAATVEHYRAA